MNIREKLIFLKKQRAMTTSELSKRSGIPVGTLNKILSGETRRVSLESMMKIAGAFQIPVQALTEGPFSPRLQEDERVDEKFFLSAEEQAFIGELRKCPPAIRASLMRTVFSISKFYRRQQSYGEILLLPCLTVSREKAQTEFCELLVKADERALQADFAVKIQDSSLTPVYYPGQVLAVKQKNIREGFLGAFLYQGELLIRKQRKREGMRYLSGLNLLLKKSIWKKRWNLWEKSWGR